MRAGQLSAVRAQQRRAHTLSTVFVTVAMMIDFKLSVYKQTLNRQLKMAYRYRLSGAGTNPPCGTPDQWGTGYRKAEGDYQARFCERLGLKCPGLPDDLFDYLKIPVSCFPDV